MTWPLVSRARYDEMQRTLRFSLDEKNADLGMWQAKHDHLVEQIISMRRDGFSVAKPATVRQSPDDEAVGLQRAEAALVLRAADVEFITKATRDIMQKTGVSEAQARAEAIRLRRDVTDEDAPV